MADEERIDIEITDGIDPKVSKSIKLIGKSADASDKTLKRLQKSLKGLDVKAITALAASQAKLTNSSARLLNAQVRQNALNIKQRESTAKLAVQQQRLATETQRTAIVTSKALAATTAAANAESRLAISTSQATVAKAKAAASSNLLGIAENKEAASAHNAASAQSRSAAAHSRAEIAALRHTVALRKAALAQNTVRRSSGLLARSMSFLKTTLVAVALAYGVRALIRLSDTYTNVNNKIRLIEKSASNTAAALKLVSDVANRSRTSLDATATLYQRASMALGDLGASQKEVLRFTETVNKSLLVSGLTASEAANGVRQLSQALNKGKLDGDEFRSVMENMPLVAICSRVRHRGLAKPDRSTRNKLGKSFSNEVKRTCFESDDHAGMMLIVVFETMRRRFLPS